jgi:uncharacterized protein YdaU (DUF1376 family)
MSKAPAMPMYWDAYLADTTHLTTEEHGAYMLLLAAMWRRDGQVPDDDRDNARILGLTPAKWRKIKARFSSTISGFLIEGGTITQEKLRKTWENTQEKIDKNRANGAKGGRAAASNNNDLGQANAANSVKPKATIPDPDPEPIREGTNVPLAIVHSKPKPDDADFAEFWDRYPRKVGKDAARKAFAKAMKAARPDDVMFGLSQQIPSLQSKDPQFIPHAASWLNQGRWTDEPEQPTPSNSPQHSRADATTRAITIAATARRAPTIDCF